MKYFSLALTLLLLACSPQEQEVLPITQEAELTKDEIVADDGVVLPMRSWLPKGRPEAVVLALHGMNDYSRGFIGTGEYFKKKGVALYAYDQRGFGANKDVGVWGGEERLVRDAVLGLELLQKKYPHTPVYLMGESMGGSVAVLVAAQPMQNKPKGLILSSPALWPMPFPMRAIMWTLAHTIPDKKMTGSELKIMATNNLPVLWRMGKDPLVIKKTRVDAIYGLTNAMEKSYDEVSKVEIPTLLLYGDQDQVIPPHPVKSSVKRFGGPVTFVNYPDGYHMLTRDIQGRQVMDDILAWIKNPAKPVPSGFTKAD
jgi:acylglycerol lipase